MEKEREFRFKIILIGPGGVGKTSLVRKYVEKAFSENYLPTIGANVMEKESLVNYQGKQALVKMTIWDIAAQDTFKRMRPAFYHGSQGAFLVADLSRPETFDEIITWDKELTAIVPNIQKVFLANKSDLPTHLSEEQVQEIGKKIHAIKVLKTSALNGENVLDAFKILTTHIIESTPKSEGSGPELKETEWRATVKYLYVADMSGILLYEQDMRTSHDEGKARDGSILSGALVAISGLLKEISENANPLKVVSQEGFTIQTEEGKHVLVALVTTKETQTSRKKIQAFLEEFENKFEGKIQDNIERGDLRLAFKTAQTVAKKIFGSS